MLREMDAEYFFLATDARQKRVLSCLFNSAGLTSISEGFSMSQKDLCEPFGVSGSVKPTAAAGTVRGMRDKQALISGL